MAQAVFVSDSDLWSLQLIAEVREHPELFDPGHVDYRDKDVRHYIWEAIGNKLEISGKGCQVRWKSLRDRYVKIKNLKASGDSTESETSWALFEHLTFLDPYLRKKRRLFGSLGERKKDDETKSKIPSDSGNEQKKVKEAKKPIVLTPFKKPAVQPPVSQPLSVAVPPGVQVLLIQAAPQPAQVSGPVSSSAHCPIRPKPPPAPPTSVLLGTQLMPKTVVKEDVDIKPILKELKIAAPQNDNTNTGVESLKIVELSSLAEKKDDGASLATLSTSTSPSSSSSLRLKIRDLMTDESDDEDECDRPLSDLVGHPNDRILKQHIYSIVENTDLREITMNGVIQKVFAMYPDFNLNYRKEFIKSTLRSLLYKLGEQKNAGNTSSASSSGSADSSVSTTNPCEAVNPSATVTDDSSSSSTQKSAISSSS